MGLLFPIAGGVATVLTLAMGYGTGKGTYRKIQKRRTKKVANKI